MEVEWSVDRVPIFGNCKSVVDKGHIDSLLLRISVDIYFDPKRIQSLHGDLLATTV